MAKTTCSIDGCDREIHSWGWCGTHYMRWLRNGDPLIGGEIQRQSGTGHPCSVDGCSKPVIARNICNNHYRRWRRYGDPTAGKPSPRSMTPVERFWSKVEKTDTCWLWTDAPNNSGYGTFAWSYGVAFMAHRLVLALEGRPVPDHLEVDHLCRVRNCVNPAHLEPVTGSENKLRAWPHRRKRAA